MASRLVVSITATGFAERAAAMRAAGAALIDFYDRQLALVAQQVARGAVVLMQPHYRGYQTGQLESTVRPARRGKAAWVVRMGDAQTPYAGWWEYGGNKPRPRPIVKGGRSLYPSVGAQTQYLRRIQALAVRRARRMIEGA